MAGFRYHSLPAWEIRVGEQLRLKPRGKARVVSAREERPDGKAACVRLTFDDGHVADLGASERVYVMALGF